MVKTNISYKKFPSVRRKLFGNDRLWVGPDHLLLVQSTGFSETYKRFFFKDIQAFNILKSNKTQLKNIIFILITVLCGAIATYNIGWDINIDGMSIFLAALFLITVIITTRSLIRGTACTCWIYTSVQKEKLNPISTVKISDKFLDMIIPLIESKQGSIIREQVETIKERTIAKPSLNLAYNSDEPKKNISTVWHKTSSIHLLALAGVILTTLYYRSIWLIGAYTLILMTGFVTTSVALGRQAGSTVGQAARSVTVLSLILFITIGVVTTGEGMYLMIKHIDQVQYTGHDDWTMLKLFADMDLSEYPIIFAMNIFFTVVSALLGILGLIYIRKRIRTDDSTG